MSNYNSPNDRFWLKVDRGYRDCRICRKAASQRWRIKAGGAS